ncbi:MAG: prepilin-type N-terminal cleavage/methylation domain-containing protein [Syntrophobacterales bacterium]|nr:MAG: prepilin-type N-terminal cleavage/methylation domain-containing protein [Syntrophobacterales bacterium]
MAKTVTSRIGILNKRGFTLIELTVVVFLIGLMLLIAVPKVRDTLLNDGLTSAVNHMVNTGGELRSDAIRNQVDYILRLNLDDGLVYAYPADATPEAIEDIRKLAYRLPQGVRMEDIYRFGGEKTTEGEFGITFFKKGYVQPTVLHLAQKDSHFTLIFEPFLSRVRTYDDYR